MLYGVLVGIFLVRASLDPLFEQTKIPLFGSPIGLGASLNAAMIGASLLLIAQSIRRVDMTIAAAWLALVGLCAVASLTSSELSVTIRLLLVLVSYMCALIVPYVMVRGPRDVRLLINTVIFSAIPPAIMVLYQVAALHHIPELRTWGTFSHPNILAFYLVGVAAAILYRLSSGVYSDPAWKKAVLIAFLLLLFVLLYFTKTRSAWAGGTLLIAAYAIFLARWLLLLLPAVPVLAFIVPGIRERILDATAAAQYIGEGVLLNSYEWRRQLWSDAWPLILDKPFLGHGGLNSFHYYSPTFFLLERDSVYAHSVFVQLAFEVGLLGPVLFLVLFALIGGKLVQGFARDRSAAVLGGTLCASYLAFAYADNMLNYLAFNWYFFFLIGIWLAWTHLDQASALAAEREREVQRLPPWLEPGPVRRRAAAGARGKRGRRRPALEA